jgi:broad specificity phosphatase PhoE
MVSSCIPFDSVILQPLKFDLRGNAGVSSTLKAAAQSDNYNIPFTGVHVIPFFIETRLWGYEDTYTGSLLRNWLHAKNLDAHRTGIASMKKLKEEPIDWIDTIRLFGNNIPRAGGKLSTSPGTQRHLWSSSICDFFTNLKQVLNPAKLSVIVGHGNVIGNLLRLAEYSSDKSLSDKVMAPPAIPNGAVVLVTLKSGSDTYSCLLVRHCLTHHNIQGGLKLQNADGNFTDLTTCADVRLLKNVRYYIQDLQRETGMNLDIYASPAIRAIETALAIQGVGLSQKELTHMTAAVREPSRTNLIDLYSSRAERTAQTWNAYVKATKSTTIELRGQKIPTTTGKFLAKNIVEVSPAMMYEPLQDQTPEAFHFPYSGTADESDASTDLSDETSS